MADLAVSQDANQLSLTDNPALPPQPIAATSISQQAGPGVKNEEANMNVGESIPPPSLPSFMSQVPLQHSLSLQLAWTIRADRWTPSDPSMQVPPENHLTLLKLGPYFASDPTTFLQGLIRVAVNQTNAVQAGEKVARWLFVTERLPILLKWWTENSSEDWIYPVSYPTGQKREADEKDTLKDALTSAFEVEKDSLATCNSWISTTLQGLSQQAENDDESGGPSQPDGW